jgi:hypothetical protein
MKPLLIAAAVGLALLSLIALAEIVGGFYPDIFAPLLIAGGLVAAVRFALK